MVKYVPFLIYRNAMFMLLSFYLSRLVGPILEFGTDPGFYRHGPGPTPTRPALTTSLSVSQQVRSHLPTAWLFLKRSGTDREDVAGELEERVDPPRATVRQQEESDHGGL